MTLTALAGTPLQVAQEAAERCGLPVSDRFHRARHGDGRRHCRHQRRRQPGGALRHDAGVGRWASRRFSPTGRSSARLARRMKNNAGYDLKQLFIGSEGAFGVVTRAVFALQPAPRWTRTCAGRRRKLRTGGSALLASARRELGPMLSAYEAMWPDYWRMVTENVAGRRDPFRRAPRALCPRRRRMAATPTRMRRSFEAWLDARVRGRDVVEDAMLAASLLRHGRLLGDSRGERRDRARARRARKF